MMLPFGSITSITMVTLPGCAFCQETHASTIARAVSALITILVKVRLATSAETVTFASVAGGPTCANALEVIAMSPRKAITVLFIFYSSVSGGPDTTRPTGQ